ncbi:MAG: hypothetical protein AB7R40_10340 [Nitrospiraceae bacterium]
MAVGAAPRFVPRSMSLVALALIFFTGMAACAGPEPILRSNNRLLLYGKDAAEREVDACREKSERAGIKDGTNRSGNAAAGGTIGVVGGAAVGAATGLVGGPTGVAIGAAAGAVIGGVLGTIGGAYKPLQPDARFTASMERCLKEKGYEVSGWQ